MKHHYVLACMAVLAVAGCHKESTPQSAPQPDYEAQAAEADAEAEERATRAHLTLSLSDEQILRAIGADPASLKPRAAPVESAGGTIQVSYANETTQIEICRTPSTGALFVYYVPSDLQKR